MNDSTGTRLHFSVAAGIAEVIELEFCQQGDEELLDLSGATFSFSARGRAGEAEVEIPVEHGSRGKVLVYVPALAADCYEYSLIAVSSLGAKRSVLYGVLSALSYAETQGVAEAAEVCARRKLVVVVPNEEGASMRLCWKASSVAGSAASVAVEAAARATMCAEQLAEAKAFIDSFNAAVRSAVRVDEAGYLWVAGYYTGVCARGRDGETPHIGANGNWWVGDVDTGHAARGEAGAAPSISGDGFWVIGGVKSAVRAAGRDGVNGTVVRRVLVECVADLPQEGERCNGGFLYYVPNDGGEYDVYAWLERGEEAGWVRVKEAYDIATAEVYGLSKLGTNVVASEGAPVAVNAAGGMVVQVASTVDYGAVKASSSVVEKFGGGGIYVNNGMLWVNMATPNKPGCVIYSAWGTTPDNYCIGPNTSGWIDVMNAGANQRGVVLAARDIADERDGAVPVAKMVKRYVDNNYLTKADTLTEISNEGEAVKKWVDTGYAKLGSGYTKSEADTMFSMYAKKDDVEEMFADYSTKQEVRELSEDTVHKTDTWSGDVVLTEAEYNRLSDAELDDTVLYIIV